MIDIAAIKDWLGLIALLISVGTSIVLFVGSGAKRNSAKLEKQEEKLTEHDRRIQRLESTLEHLPSRETTHKLELALEQIAGQLAVMDARLKPIEPAIYRLQEALVEKSK